MNRPQLQCDESTTCGRAEAAHPRVRRGWPQLSNRELGTRTRGVYTSALLMMGRRRAWGPRASHPGRNLLEIGDLASWCTSLTPEAGRVAVHVCFYPGAGRARKKWWGRGGGTLDVWDWILVAPAPPSLCLPGGSSKLVGGRRGSRQTSELASLHWPGPSTMVNQVDSGTPDAVLLVLRAAARGSSLSWLASSTCQCLAAAETGAICVSPQEERKHRLRATWRPDELVVVAPLLRLPCHHCRRLKPTLAFFLFLAPHSLAMGSVHGCRRGSRTGCCNTYSLRH